MASKRQKVHQSMVDIAPATSDLISDLPADIIMKILLRLPLQEAVRTSLLSKGWRYKWRTIPHLIFNRSTFRPISKVANSSDLLAIIHQVLLQHEGPVPKFQLVVPHLPSCPEIDPLISFLSRRNIEEFTLIWQGNHKIPSHLFSCLKMRLLCLHTCVLKPPPDFAGFAKLTVLELCSVDLPASFAETFVARCPLLECLKLWKCTNFDSVDFYAPNLQELRYQGQISSVCFKNTPSVKKLSIECLNSLKSSRNTWIDTFRSLPSLEYLKLGPRFNFMLDGSDILLNSLVTLELHSYIGITRRGALSLIKSSPNLQKLKLYFLEQKENDAAAIQLSKVKETWEGSLEKLQSIEIFYFSGLKTQMAVMELLLAKSPVLKTMRVFYLKGWSEDNKISSLEKILQMPRASPTAKLILVEQKLSNFS